MEVSLIRIYLLAGLILHKAVWEILKRRGPAAAPAPAPSSKARVLSLIKIAILAGIVAQTLAPEIAPISSQPQTLRAVDIAIYTLGLMMAVVSRCQLGRNWSDIEKSRVKRDHMLVAHGRPLPSHSVRDLGARADLSARLPAVHPALYLLF